MLVELASFFSIFCLFVCLFVSPFLPPSPPPPHPPLSLSASPSPSPNGPAGHGVHPVDPVLFAYVPVLQAVHELWPPGLNDPAPHNVHELASLPDTCPAGQGSHEGEPRLAAKLPPLQAEHCVAPLELYFPAGQRRGSWVVVGHEEPAVRDVGVSKKSFHLNVVEQPKTHPAGRWCTLWPQFGFGTSRARMLCTRSGIRGRRNQPGKRPERRSHFRTRCREGWVGGAERERER